MNFLFFSTTPVILEPSALCYEFSRVSSFTLDLIVKLYVWSMYKKDQTRRRNYSIYGLVLYGQYEDVFKVWRVSSCLESLITNACRAPNRRTTSKNAARSNTKMNAFSAEKQRSPGRISLLSYVHFFRNV